MKRILPITIFLITSSLFSKSQTTASQIHFGIYIKNIMVEERAKEKSNRFTIDAYWWIRYQMPKDTSLINEIENIEFINAEIKENEIDERYIFLDTISNSRFVYVTGHIKGDFIFYPNYKYYPYDKSILPITIESKNLVSEKFQLIPDTISYEKKLEKIMGISNDIEIPGFAITKAQYKQNEKVYETNFGDPRFQTHLKYSRLTFEIVLERKSTTFLLKILIPIILITLMAYLVFFVPAAQLEVAVGLTVTSLLACIALQLTLSADIPVTGHLISTDNIFYLSYSLITFAMIQTVYTYSLEKKNKIKLAHKLEILSRWLYPIIFILFTLITILTSIHSKP